MSGASASSDGAGTAVPRSSVGAVLRGSSATVVCAFPVFATGALAVQLREDLAFGAVGLGAAVAVHHGVAAVLAIPGGRFTDRMGAVFSLRVAVALSVVATLGVAFATNSLAALMVWLLVAGCARALAQPGANRLLVNRVRPDRLGIAFGIKQSAPPIASLLGGLSVPLIALTFGWRWAFAGAAGASVIVLLTLSGRLPTANQARRAVASAAGPLRDRRTLLVLAMGFALGFGANSALLAFLVTSAVDAGTSQQFAGTLLAVASLAAIVTRILGGFVCDRTNVQPMFLSASLLVVGAVGLAMLVPGLAWLLPVGGVVATIGTWGFPGAFWLAIMRAYPDAPGRATGAVAPGAAGGILGPVVFGVLADRFGYGAGWAFLTVVAVLSGVMMFVADRRLRRQVPIERTA